MASKLDRGMRIKENGRYEFRFSAGERMYSVSGKSATECREKRDALIEKLREEERQAEEQARIEADRKRRGLTKDGEDYRCEDYLDQWLENQIHLKSATVRTYRKMINRICSQKIGKERRIFGDICLGDLQAQTIRDLQRSLRKDDLQTRTINDNLSLLKKALTDAVNECMIERNPCNAVRRLPREEVQVRETIHRALTAREIEAFMRTAEEKGSPYCNLYTVLLYTGLRIGEASALTVWDFGEKDITINKTVTRTETGFKVARQTKTEAGRRRVPISPAVREAVEKQKEQNLLLYGECRTDLPLFLMPRGGIIRGDRVNEDIRRICDAAKIQYFSVHAFRATFTSKCVAAGVDVKNLMEILGHVDVQMTMGLYAHADDMQKREQLLAVSFM